MKNYFLLSRDMRSEILIFIRSQEDGSSENDVIHHILHKFGSNQVVKMSAMNTRLKSMIKKLVDDNKIKRFVFHLDGDDINWYLDHGADLPAWMFALEEGADWSL